MTQKDNPNTPTFDNPLITEVVMRQYEWVRQSGRANMFDMPAVYTAAKLFGYTELAQILKQDLESERDDRYATSVYAQLLSNYGYYLKKYAIRQEDV